MRCIFIIEESYDVHTHWGWFRLDEGAYRDYLEGRLWISWTPGKPNPPPEQGRDAQQLPPHVTEEAVRLRDAASRQDLTLFLREHFPGCQAVIPYRARMKDIPIQEMSLSVRSSNGLMRAGAGSFGKLYDLLSGESGLRGVRNLGAKSEAEILACFLSACYSFLTPGEKAAFWQQILSDSEGGEREPGLAAHVAKAADF